MMKTISFNIPKPWIELLDELVGESVYESRGNAIRCAIRTLLILHGKLR